MKKSIYIVSIFLLLAHISFGQGFNLFDAKGFNPGSVTDAVVDELNGFIYITGQFDPADGTLDFNPDPLSFQGAPDTYGGITDIFIAKYTTGGALLWVKAIGSDGDDYPNKIKLDAAGSNVFVVGRFDGSTFDLDPDAGATNIANFGVDYDGFGVKLQAATGIYQDGYFVSFLGFDDVSGIDIDASNIYMTGTAGGSVFFDRTNIFFVGSAIQLLATNASQYGEDIFVKSDGLTFVINGGFSGGIDFDPVFNLGSFTAITAGGFDMFFAEYNATTLAYVGHKTIAGLGNDFITNSALDPSDNLFITGIFDGQINFDTNGGTSNLFPDAGDDIFVAKYNSTGSLLWAKSIGGPLDDFSGGLALNVSGDVFVTGLFEGNVDFDPSSGSSFNLQSVNEDCFLLKLKSNGDLVDAIRIGNTGYDEGETLAVNGSDVILFAGFENISIDVDPGCNEVSIDDGYGFLTYDDPALPVQLPVITSNTTLTVNVGTDVNVSVNVNDVQGCPITSVKIVFAALDELQPDNPLYTEDVMTNSAIGSDTYTYTIAGKTSGIGVMFNVEATNARGLVGYSDDFGVAVNITSTGYTIPYSSFGSAETNYRIVSVPLTGFDASIGAIFDELGTYDKARWRMYEYAGNSTRELNQSSTMAIGKGYWLIAKENPGAITVGGGTTASATLYEPFVIKLASGWNLIGNPYNFDINWSDILAWNGDPTEITPELKVYTGSGSYSDGLELQKFSGGFVLSSASFQLEIPAYKDPVNGRKSHSNSSRDKNAIDQPDWEVRLNAKNGSLVNTFGGVGMNSDASEDFDRYDDLSLPRFLNYVELVHDNPQKFQSFFSRDIVPTTENYVWDFSIESNTQDNHIELDWENEYFGNNDKQLYLWDNDLQLSVDMRATKNYVFDKTVSRSFQVIYGDVDFVKEKTTVNSLVFHQVSPNPVVNKAVISFSVPETVNKSAIELSTVDLLGRKVWSHSDLYSSGYHEVDVEIDREFTKGVYIVQIRSGKVSKHKRIIIK